MRRSHGSLLKEEGREQEVHEITSLAINLFRVLNDLSKTSASRNGRNSQKLFLILTHLIGMLLRAPLLSHQINKFKPLMTRIEDEQIEAMIESSKG